MEVSFLDVNRVDVSLKKFIKSNTEWLSEQLDPDFGLLHDLLRSRVLSMKETNQVKCLPESFARSEKLLTIVLEKDVQEKFIEALRNTKQTHLANFIVAKGERMSVFGDDWPLTDQQIQSLDTNRGALVDLIDSCELLYMLYSKNVINKRQIEAIASKLTSYEKNDLLLDIMRRKSLNDYKVMIDCLRVTNQSHIAQILNDGEVILALHADLEASDVGKAEEEIVTKLTNILSCKTLEESDRIWGQTKLKLIAVKKGHSVILYIQVKTVEELICIEEGIASGKLTSHITALFYHLLSRTSIARLNNVYIDLSKDAYNKAKQLLSVKGQEQFRDQSEAEEHDSMKDETVVNNLPLELIDIILQSAVQLHMMSKESQIRPTDFIRKLLSVDQCWFQRITKSRLKKTMWRRLSALFKRYKRKSTVIRNNEAYLLENIQTEQLSIKPEMTHSIECDGTKLLENIHKKKLIRTLCMTDCLTDVQTRLIKSVKRNIAKNAELLRVIRTCDDKRHNGLVQCLRECNQRFATRVIDMGGVVVKLQLGSDRTATKETNKQILVQKLNDLRDNKKPRSEQTEELLRQLNDNKMEILNSVNDHQTVVWIWCQSQEALQKLQTMIEYTSLSEFFSNLLKSIPLIKEQEVVRVALQMKNDGISEQVSVNIDRDQLKKQVVDYKLVMSDCTTLDIRGWGVVGVTKLRDRIFVLHRTNVILVFEERSPFELKEEIEVKELENPKDIVSNEKENCLYVIDGNGCLWRLADDLKIISLKRNFAGRRFTISVSRDGRLVLTTHSTPISSLEICGPDGELLLAYRLPMDFRNPLHAVETSTGNFVILHEWLSPSKYHWIWVVSELAIINGKLIPTRRFAPKDDPVMDSGISRYVYQELEWPIYLSLDSDDRVFVSDQDSGRIILLDRDLYWMQILRLPKHSNIPWPKRMCYDDKTKQLIVVINRGFGVNIYTLTNR